MRKFAVLLCAIFAFVLLPAIAAGAEELAVGAKGEEVEKAQTRLRELNYLEGAADGVFGNQTATALEIFQRMNALEVTGTLNEETSRALYSASAQALPEGLEKGDEGDAVVALQTRLRQLGYLDDEIDGKYGTNTQRAVKEFQQFLISQGVGVSESGNAGSITLAYLEDEEFSTWTQDLQPGTQDEDVLRVERRLRDLGYLDAEPDEELDTYAVLALQAFQAAQGLEVGEVADKETFDSLFCSEAKQAESFVPHDIWEGDENLAVKALQENLARYGMMDSIADGKYGSETTEALNRFYAYLLENESVYAEQFALVGGVSAGAQELFETEDFFFFQGEVGEDSGEEEILRVQRRLYSLYYLGNGKTTGYFGDITREALEQFQQNNGLEVNGRADEATLRRLFSPAAVGNWTKYKLEIDIDAQRVYVYALNTFNEYELEKTMICSTGLGNTTPTGVFLKTQPLNRWHYFKKFECWAQYSYQIEGDILFHSVLYSQKSESTLRYGSVYALGKKASHGCVRLKVEDAKWIYETCERGTVVVVY